MCKPTYVRSFAIVFSSFHTHTHAHIHCTTHIRRRIQAQFKVIQQLQMICEHFVVNNSIVICFSFDLTRNVIGVVVAGVFNFRDILFELQQHFCFATVLEWEWISPLPLPYNGGGGDDDQQHHCLLLSLYYEN